MNALSRFWSQPLRAYRNFQIVYTILTLNFVIPAISYAVAPGEAYRSFTAIGRILGVETYGISEESYLWRLLAVANVLTLGATCFLLQLNVRRFYAALLPLAFLKGTAATLFLAAWIVSFRYPAFLGVFLLDGVSTVAMIVFATGAARAIERHPDARLVPALWRGPASSLLP